MLDLRREGLFARVMDDTLTPVGESTPCSVNGSVADFKWACGSGIDDLFMSRSSLAVGDVCLKSGSAVPQRSRS